MKNIPQIQGKKPKKAKGSVWQTGLKNLNIYSSSSNFNLNSNHKMAGQIQTTNQIQSPYLQNKGFLPPKRTFGTPGSETPDLAGQ